ncbi:MAG: CCE_0567 family metalloprotein [Bacteroidota bacterium]|nr:CCE_0567 family metalloprotein [Bacteroidota bacterium]
MSKSEIIELEKAVNKAKFKLTQEAGALHDLIEDRLMSDFNEIPAFAEAAYKAACEWSALKEKLSSAKSI